MSGVGGREAAVRRVNEALQAYTLSGEGWRRGPGETLQCVLADLLHWCDGTQRDFDAALRRARAQHAAAGGEATGDA
ncbi:hypothetical protein [Streptomyces noursei]|uniref:hypothetical protein n=1 Tax=Streptomyces noursei TaxID=1971 RepID=UPI0030F2927B